MLFSTAQPTGGENRTLKPHAHPPLWTRPRALGCPPLCVDASVPCGFAPPGPPAARVGPPSLRRDGSGSSPSSRSAPGCRARGGERCSGRDLGRPVGGGWAMSRRNVGSMRVRRHDADGDPRSAPGSVRRRTAPIRSVCSTSARKRPVMPEPRRTGPSSIPASRSQGPPSPSPWSSGLRRTGSGIRLAAVLPPSLQSLGQPLCATQTPQRRHEPLVLGFRQPHSERTDQ